MQKFHKFYMDFIYLLYYYTWGCNCVLNNNLIVIKAIGEDLCCWMVAVLVVFIIVLLSDILDKTKYFR